MSYKNSLQIKVLPEGHSAGDPRSSRSLEERQPCATRAWGEVWEAWPDLPSSEF